MQYHDINPIGVCVLGDRFEVMLNRSLVLQLHLQLLALASAQRERGRGCALCVRVLARTELAKSFKLVGVKSFMCSSIRAPPQGLHLQREK